MFSLFIYGLNLLLLLFSVGLMYQVMFRSSFLKSKIVQKKNEEDCYIVIRVVFLVLILGYLYLTATIQIFNLLFFDSMSKAESISLVVWLYTLMFASIGSFHYFEKISTKKEPLTRFALKQTSIPDSIIEFIIDGFVLNLNTHEEKSFPLYTQTSLFISDILKDNRLKEPSIQKYLIDNIVFLTTVMNIINNEDLVAALSNEIGTEELGDILKEFEEVHNGLLNLIEVNKSEDLKQSKAEAIIKSVSGLNEIHSMRELSKSIR